MEATVYTLSVLASLVAAVATLVAIRRANEGRAFELVLVDADRSA